MSDVILDANGQQIFAGDRVRVGKAWGYIRQISDFDADYDGERYHAINPSVTVDFDDGTDDSFMAFWTATGPWDSYQAPYQCDDVERLITRDECRRMVIGDLVGALLDRLFEGIRHRLA